MAQLQGGQGDASAGLGQVILVGVADLLDQAIQVQAFEQPGHLWPRAVAQDAAQSGDAEADDLPFAPHKCEEQLEVVGVEQVEALVTSLLQADGICQPLHLLDTGRGVVQVGEEGQVAAVGRKQQFAQWVKPIDAFLHGGEFGLGGAIPVFHRLVVAKERDVVDRRLDPQDRSCLS